MSTLEQSPLLGGLDPEPDPGGRRAAPGSHRPAVAQPASERCCLVTNHLNLSYMLSAGLVLPKSGFSKKYYRDTLDICPGWIPLFIGAPWPAAADHAVAEADYLKRCQVIVSLRECAGQVMVPGPNGVEERRWPHEAGGASLIFVRAPLPVSAIVQIRFASRDDEKAYRAVAQDHDNVPLADFETRVNVRGFTATRGPQWPPEHVPPKQEAPLGQAQAAGGMLAMLRLLANRDAAAVLDGGEPLSLAMCRAGFDPGADPPPDLSVTVAAGLAAWLRSRPSSAPMAVLPGIDFDARRLFWEAIDALAERAGEVGAAEANARLLDYLDGAAKSLTGRLREHVVDLRRTLDSLTGLADRTVSDLFDRFKKPFSRAMCLLFLRSTCAELLAFEHQALTKEDRLAAALLFGARAGWLGLPLSLRGGASATAAISHRMAALSHRLAGTGFELGPAPARPKALAELFAGAWDKRRHGAAVELARAQKWTDCLQTRVRLGPGDYELKVGGGRTEIVFPGEARVKTEVVRAKFVARLKAGSIDPKNEEAAMKKLPSGC